MVDNRAYIVEFVGTLILCFHVFCSGWGSSLGMICGYMVFMLLAARISGGHFNPGITMGMLIMDKCSGKTFLFYFLSHLLGSVGAAVLHLVFIGGYAKVGNAFDAEQIWQMILLFMGAQIVLTVIYLLIATNSKSPRSAFSFCVPLTQMFVNSFSRWAQFPFLGNCAVIMGGSIFSQNWGAFIASVVGCLGGGALGGLIYKNFLMD